MRIKKVLPLACMALIAAAFTAPASALAEVWTIGGETLGEEEEAPAEQAFEGVLELTNPAPGHIGYSCQVTIKIKAKGASTGEVTQFTPTTTKCAGSGGLANCTLKNDKSNPPWNIDISSTPGTITGPVTIHQEYANCGFNTTHLVFNTVSVTVSLTLGVITKLDVSGTATNGVTKLSGFVTPEKNEGEIELGTE